MSFVDLLLITQYNMTNNILAFLSSFIFVGFSNSPCPPLLHSTVTCSSITLFVSHNNYYYYIQYRVYSNDNSSDYWLKTSLRNDSIITIENLLPATPYQFNTVLVGTNDNSTASNSVLYITSRPSK